MFIIPHRPLRSGGALTGPTIALVSPNLGSASGGTSVVLTGTNFTGATAVSFGGTAAASFTVNSSTQITATTAAHAAGAGDVVVTTPGGAATVTGGFTFSSGSYVGPADVTGFGANVLEYWGMRAMDAAYAATAGPLADYLRDDAATYTLHCLSNGQPDKSGLVSWLGGHTAMISKVYGQKQGVHLSKDPSGFNHPGPNGPSSGGANGNYPAMGFFQASVNPWLKSTTPALAAHALPVTVSAALQMNGNSAGWLFDINSAALAREIALQLYQNYGAVRLVGPSDYSHFYSAIGTNYFHVSEVFQGTPAIDNNGDQQATGDAFTPSAIGANSVVLFGCERPGAEEQSIPANVIEWMITAGAVSMTNLELLRANQQAAGIIT